MLLAKRHIKSAKKIGIVFFFLMIISFKFVSAQSCCEIKGVVRSADSVILAHVSISLWVDKINIANTITDEAGYFMIKYDTSDSLRMEISHASYKKYVVSFKGNVSQSIDVRLQKTEENLQEVVVQSNQKQIEVQDGNLIFNVAANLNAQGIDALELLKKTPGVFVENESVISLNGKQGPLILIDGRQTYLSGRELADLLRSMPSSSIRSIEIISAPSAKYDAVGTAGIINIRTIKSQLKGTSGAFTTGAAVGVTLKQNTDISLNHRRGKWNLFGSYNHFFGHYSYLYGNDRVQNSDAFSSFTDDTDKRNRMSTRLGADLTLNKNHTIGFLATGNFVIGGGITRTNTSVAEFNTQPHQFLYAENDYYYQSTERYNFNLNYRYDNGKGAILNVDGDYGTFSKGNKNRQSNIYSNAAQMPFKENFYHSINGIAIDLQALKLDYVIPLWKGELEAGGKFSTISAENDARFFYVLPAKDSLDERRTNNFDFQESIGSAYISYNRKLPKWTFQIGLRMESTHSEGQLNYTKNGTDTAELIKRSYANLFPSLAITHKIDANNNLSFNYSRRIDRPAYQDLNPFIYLLDELSFWQGNPFLLPQYSHRISAQYLYKSSTIATVAFTHTRNFTARITDTLNGNSIVMVPRNLGNQQVLAFSLTQTISPKTWWDMMINGNLNYISNNISFDEYRALELRRFAGRLSLSQTFRLSQSFSMELASYFNSRRLTGGNEVVNPNSQVDVSFQKTFWKKKGLLRLSFIDIYKGNKINSRQEFEGFYMRSHAYYETRQIRLNFTYKFSSAAAKAPRTRTSALESENSRIRQ